MQPGMPPHERVDDRLALMAENGVAHVPSLITINELVADPTAAGLPAEMAYRVGLALHGQGRARGPGG